MNESEDSRISEKILSVGLYFYSNACHICQKYGKEVNLRCSECKMFAYCSRKHRQDHRREHKDLCRIIGARSYELNFISFLYMDKNDMDADLWDGFRMKRNNLKSSVTSQLGRELQPYEEDIFRFPRECQVCYKTDHRKLIDCPDCPATSFCLVHANAEHKEICEMTRLCFEIETGLYQAPNDVPLVNIGKDIPKDMQHVMEHYRILYDKQTTELPSNIWTTFVSGDLTRSYTFLYGLQKLFIPKSPLNIHILGANYVEDRTMRFWEILFHHQKSLANFHITLIGPHLDDTSPILLDLCKDCKSNGAQLHVTKIKKYYHDYVTSKQYTKPHFIVGFNLGMFTLSLLPMDTWPQTIKEIKKQKCPFLLTSYSLLESLLEHETINRVLKKDVKYAHFDGNPYRSLKPTRSTAPDSIIYSNQYLTIYKKL